MVNKLHKVKLVGLNDRAKKIISYYNNDLFLREYDDYGRPLNIKNGESAIFCVSPDNFWHGWFLLDTDVRFEEESKNVKKSIERLNKEPPVL